MGEMSEMVLSGLRCEGCGTLMGDCGEPGHPRRCAACDPPRRQQPAKPGRSARRRAQRKRAAERAAMGKEE